MGRVKSPLKYVGGKRELVPVLRPYLRPWLEGRRELIVPFCGGMGDVFELVSGRGEGANAALPTIYASDSCLELINFWRVLKRDPGALLAAWTWSMEHSPPWATTGDPPQPAFYEWRANLNRGGFGGTYAALAYLVVNSFGHNGLWRVNAQGGCNVPAGSAAKNPAEGRRVAERRAEDLQLAGELLRELSIELIHCDWRHAFPQAAEPRAVIYNDPPYLGTFTGYSAAQPFSGGAEHRALLEACAAGAYRGNDVVLCNSVAVLDLVAELPREHRPTVVPTSRSGTMNRDGAKRGRVDEVLLHWPGRRGP